MSKTKEEAIYAAGESIALDAIKIRQEASKHLLTLSMTAISGLRCAFRAR